MILNINLLKDIWNRLKGKTNDSVMIMLIIRRNDRYELVKDSWHMTEEAAMDRLNKIADEYGGDFDWHYEFGYNTYWRYDRTVGIQLYFENYKETTDHE